MPDVVILTSRDLGPSPGAWWDEQAHREDGAVGAALESRGLSVERVCWDDRCFDWRTTRAALVRSTWDYSVRVDEFRAFLARAGAQTMLVNPVETIRWNLDKRYLVDLSNAGLRVPPTEVLERGSRVDLARLLAERGWGEAVVKPAVSGAARATFRVTAAAAASQQPALDASLAAEAMLVQPFVAGVIAQGEVSVIVIDGRPTHAVRKVAKAGDFRVQDDHGGKVYQHAAEPDELAFAAEALERCRHRHLYARVDMARDAQGRLNLIELELIEPELFFRFQPEAAQALAAAVERSLNGAPARR